MNPEKVGKFIRELRKKNNLTQNDLANKYGVTYQAVSKWENGTNLPEITLLHEMSKDFGVSIESLLDGELTTKKKTNYYIWIIVGVIVLLLGIISFLILNNHSSFQFKTITTTCKEFKVSGSLAYNKEKSSIYISNINYCGGEDNNIYKKIECNLYEEEGNTIKKVSSCKENGENIKLEDYLKEIEINIDNYLQQCKSYTHNSLYLEINATLANEKVITYKIPLKLNDNCQK